MCVEGFVVARLGAVADWAGPGMLMLLLLLPGGFSGVVEVVKSFMFAANWWRRRLEVLQFLAELFDFVHFVFALVSGCFFEFAFGPNFPFVLAAFFEAGRVGGRIRAAGFFWLGEFACAEEIDPAFLRAHKVRAS